MHYTILFHRPPLEVLLLRAECQREIEERRTNVLCFKHTLKILCEHLDREPGNYGEKGAITSFRSLYDVHGRNWLDEMAANITMMIPEKSANGFTVLFVDVNDRSSARFLFDRLIVPMLTD